tara:strand:- start:61 stop:4644 length:4584 start_codon:yes stop_codon:yes gene_type:complete
MVTIEREVLTTQTQDIFYFSDVPDVFFGDGLESDPQENWINPDGNDIGFQNYDELSGSIDDTTLDGLISQSLYNYPNLNTDFNEFENHTFFGSAKKKLENFKTKVETIQSHYSDISSSLFDSGVAIGGDSLPVTQKRKNLFKKINKEFKTFTPYERFLYYDGQNETTASAPGLGKNYADTIPVTQQVNTGEAITLNGFDGFNVVYQHSNKRLSTEGGGTIGDNIGDNHVDLFTGKYQVHEKPFFNYSGSIYLSFLLKGTDSIPITSPLNNENSREIKLGGDETISLPFDAFYVNDVLKPEITASAYRRFIYEVSSSYFVPKTSDNDMIQVSEFGVDSEQFTMLGGSVKTGSSKIKDSTGKYPTTVITQSGVPFFGSVMPAGELFRVNYSVEPFATNKQSFITDVNVTFNNPTDVLPFDNVYKTTSTEWTNWYNDLLTKAETFDTNNIHSFENNLPLYIQESSDYNDMKGFLNLQGEQYDLIRNHIDSMGTIHNRGYKKTNSPPNNTLPMLLNNMGWQAINPFDGDLTTTLGSYLSGITSIDDIKNNTWRKTLNNLLYIYKSKGTKNSVRALLNTYGYPPDVLEFQEFGGSTEESNPRIFVNTPPIGSGVDLSLNNQSGSFSFTSKKEKLYRYSFGGSGSLNQKRILNLDWWMDNANVNSLEFIYKHVNTTNPQTILNSSGSGALKATGSIQVLSSTTSDFDGKLLRITSSDGTKKTYIFDDDNDGATGTTDGSGNVRIQINGLTQRDEIASEISTSISHTNGHFGKINVVDSTQFFTSNGSSFTTSDGQTFFVNSSGSVFLTQIKRGVQGNNRIISNAPSMSVSGFLHGSDKQTLWDLRLIPDTQGVSSSFQFRLSNTSHASASVITASNALTMSTNYAKITNGQLWNVMLQRMTSSVSGSGINEYRLHTALQEGKSIKTYNYVTMSVNGGISKDSNYFANQNWTISGSRHPLSSSNLFVGETHSGSLSQIRGWSTALSTSKFRQHVLNKFSTIGNTINSHKDELIYNFKLNENYSSASVSSSNQNFKIVDSAPTTTYLDYSFTKPGTTFNTSSVYGVDLIEVVKLTLQDNVSKANNNNILINPRRNVVGNLSPIAVSVKPLTQENSKPLFNTSPKLELYRSPQTFVDNFILDNLSGYNLETLYGNPTNYYSQSYNEFDTFRENFFDAHPITIDTNKFIRAHENMFNHSIVEAVKSVVPARSTFSDKNSNFGVEIRPTILEKQKYENEEHSIEANPNRVTGSINPSPSTSDSKFVQPNSASVSVSVTNITTNELPYSASIGRGYVPFGTPNSISSSLKPSTTGSLLVLPKSGSITATPSLTDSAIVFPKSGSIDYALIANESFVNIHDSWGTGANDTHFINYGGGKSSVTNDYNTGHIDTRFVFHSIGDNEYYSASMGKSSTFDEHTRFYNRLLIDDDFHSEVTYESLINGTIGGQSGRMMGKTRYFLTSSNGNITLPRNHVTKFSQPFKEQMIDGAQNTNPGVLNVQYEDYSTASFYRVKVTGGENEIIVQSGQSNLDSNNKIIYD